VRFLASIAHITTVDVRHAIGKCCTSSSSSPKISVDLLVAIGAYDEPDIEHQRKAVENYFNCHPHMLQFVPPRIRRELAELEILPY
jgi:hypothetical protein